MLLLEFLQRDRESGGRRREKAFVDGPATRQSIDVIEAVGVIDRLFRLASDEGRMGQVCAALAQMRGKGQILIPKKAQTATPTENIWCRGPIFRLL